MLHSRNESVTIKKDHDIDKQVALEVKPLVHPSQDDTLVQLVQDDEPHIFDERDAPQEQQYTIAIDRSRRQIKHLQRYEYVDLIFFTLSMIESIEISNLIDYHEAITSSESIQ